MAAKSDSAPLPVFQRWAQDDKVRARLMRLAASPPQTLLLEGGNEIRRLHMALYWAMASKCAHARAGRDALAEPCGTCPICLQIQGNENADLRLLDGRISNSQDEEKPGPVRALNIDNVRELKIWANGAPRGEGPRIAIVQGLLPSREEALNGLLKTLEEPSPHTLFVVLTPQREQILPTIVSRALCVTLPWSDCEPSALEDELAVFLQTGQGRFLDNISARGALDAERAGRVLLACQKAMLTLQTDSAATSLRQALLPLADSGWTMVSAWFGEAQAMLAGGVAPARVLTALMGRLFVLLAGLRGAPMHGHP